MSTTTKTLARATWNLSKSLDQLEQGLRRRSSASIPVADRVSGTQSVADVRPSTIERSDVGSIRRHSGSDGQR
jgi:hypothetical protein